MQVSHELNDRRQLLTTRNLLSMVAEGPSLKVVLYRLCGKIRTSVITAWHKFADGRQLDVFASRT